jgi:cytidine deaminase
VSSVELDPEDAKLVALARASRARTGAAEGAAVRDDMGRTYAAASVALPSLSLTAVQAAVAAAVSSGAQRLEAAAVVSDSATVDADSAAALADLGVTATITADATGVVRA